MQAMGRRWHERTLETGLACRAALREASMAIETRINGETYERLALAEPDRKWELRDGHLREKPAMTSAQLDRGL
jgi:hypothetical protein